MQVALGRLQVAIFVVPRMDERSVESAAPPQTPLERVYRHERALQGVEADRAQWVRRANRVDKPA